MHLIGKTGQMSRMPYLCQLTPFWYDNHHEPFNMTVCGPFGMTVIRTFWYDSDQDLFNITFIRTILV